MIVQSPPPGADDALTRAAQLVGDKWVLAILGRAMFHDVTRFGDFQKALGIPTNVLARRLAAMTEAGILERVPTPEHRSPHQYRLTAKGEDLRPVVSALVRWSTDWPAREAAARNRTRPPAWIWPAATPPAEDHTVKLGGLAFGRLLPSSWSHRRPR